MSTKMMKTLLLFLIAGVSFSAISCGQSKKDQHPNKQALVQDVRNYIQQEQKKNKGYFLVYDSVADKQLKLKLSKVHTDKFSRLGDKKYFDCANFKGKNGTLYDIDIFMKWNGKNFESTSKRMVHKVNNKARYVWYEDNGIWKTKKPESGAKKDSGDKHPAH